MTAFLNSTLFKFAFKECFPELLGESRELRKVFFENIPVKPTTSEGWFAQRIGEIQANKQRGQPTELLEKEIDEKLFDLYELDESKRALIRKVTDS